MKRLKLKKLKSKGQKLFQKQRKEEKQHHLKRKRKIKKKIFQNQHQQLLLNLLLCQLHQQALKIRGKITPSFYLSSVSFGFFFHPSVSLGFFLVLFVCFFAFPESQTLLFIPIEIQLLLPSGVEELLRQIVEKEEFHQ